MTGERRDTAPETAAATLAPEAGPASAASPGLAPPQQLALRLQRAGGNAAVARTLQARSAAAGGGGVLAREAEEAKDDGFIGGAIRGLVRDLPGYDLATLIAGADPLTGAAVTLDRRALVEQVLGHGPFAAGIGPVLSTLDVLDDIFTVISNGLDGHNLTFSRITKDFEDAWEEVSLIDGIDANVAIVERYVDRLIDDVIGFVDEIADHLIELVRAAAVEVAEPFLERPEIAPVWSLAKKVMHYDPLRGEDVDAPTVEILADFLRLIGQEERLAQMQERGTLQQTADWLDTQTHTFLELLETLRQLFADAWAAISPANLPNLLDTLPGLADRALGLMRGVRDFASTLIGEVLRLVKQSLLGMLAEHAHKVPGFHLLTVLLGRNPFTGEQVLRTPQNLIRGFITLMPGGEAIYDQLAESGVIGRAAARIEGAIDRLGITWELVTGTFHAIWDGLSLDDLLAPIAAFTRIVDQFGEPLARIVDFVGEVVQTVVELILGAMNFPSDLLGSILDGARRAIDDITRDPVGFLQNMLRALKDGVGGFLSNIVGYLRDGVIGWLTHGLGKAGVQLPADWSLGSVVTLVLDVLGIGMEQLWDKLAKKTSPGVVAKIRGGIDKLTGAWQWIKDVMERGIGALWEHLTDQLGSLWDTLLGLARDWIMGELIEKALTRLVSMLDPTGIMAIIRSAQAFFNAIESAVEYLRDILGIVNEYVSTLAQVAAGNISAGAQKLEQGLAHAIPIALGFLANQVGITDVPEKISEIIGKLREIVEQALDWLVDKAWELGKSALSALGIGGDEDGDGAPAGEGGADGEGGAQPAAQEPIRAPFEDEEQHTHNVSLEGAPGEEPVLMVRSDPKPFDQVVAKLRGEVDALPDPPAGAPAGAGPSKAELHAALEKVVQDATSSGLTEEAKGLWKEPTKRPGAASSLGKRINDLARQLGEVTKHIRADNPHGDPQRGADGIGEVKAHGRQGSSNRTGHPLHWTTSEHVLPFAVGKQLWRLAGVDVPDRGNVADRAQHTVMIYIGAADEKTKTDGEVIAGFAAFIDDVGGEHALDAALRRRGEGDEAGGEALGLSLVAQISNELLGLRAEAVGRTRVAVDYERELRTGGAALTNAERRGPPETPEPRAPSGTAVADAAEQQYKDLLAVLTAAVAEARRREELALA